MMTALVRPAPGDGRSEGGQGVHGPREATAVHTRIFRLALGLEDSRAYWEHVGATGVVPRSADRAVVAFEQRWFGPKSLERVRFLLAAFAERYDAFPEALGVLGRWRAMDPTTRALVCHWHTQLSDPLYRRFTGDFLPRRRTQLELKVDRDIVMRWVQAECPERWSAATEVQFASKLLSTASEAGLLTAKGEGRALLFPRVSDLALGYVVHLLRRVRFVGTLTENPYLTSVGLEGAVLDQRLRTLSGVTFRRMAHLTEFDWAYPTLRDWAEASL